ncbi:MAG: DUF2752 domain-containing protein [Planctomycetaceae bacterium]
MNLPIESESRPPSDRGQPLSRGVRLVLVLWGLFLSGGFVVASRLEPDPRGYGTHQRLGLPECSFRSWFGIPCPSCGGTTAFALFVRGRWIESARANLSAFGAAILSAVLIPWSLYSSGIGHTWGIQRPDVAGLWILGVMGTIAILQWLAILCFAT